LNLIHDHTDRGCLVYCLEFNFYFDDATTPVSYTLSLHDALPISRIPALIICTPSPRFGVSTTTVVSATAATSSSDWPTPTVSRRSEEHTSELQSRFDLVCRLLLEKKKKSSFSTSVVASAYTTHVS